MICLRKEIKRARELSDGIIGVNIMVALSDFSELVITSVEEGVDVLFLGAGLPLHLPSGIALKKIKRFDTKIVPIVSSGKATELIFKYWLKNYKRVPDAVVVEGPKAGGHLGFKREQIDDPKYQLESLIPQVIEVVAKYEKECGREIPVIAAGGIYTGHDIYRFIKMGVKGVQMATRFVATYECDASDIFKEAYVQCEKEDIMIIQSPVGLPGRAIRNGFLEDVEKGMRKPFTCPWKCLKTCNYKESPYCIALALTNAKKGYLSNGFAFIGANGYKVDKIVHVKDLIGELVREYEEMASKDKS